MENTMNFAFSEEQDELRGPSAASSTDKSPETEVRRLMETTEGYDPAVWTQMAEQLGLQRLTIPEEFGGSGFSYVELIVVLEEMGPACCARPSSRPWPWPPTPCSPRATTKAKEYLLPGIASGETIGTLAFTEDSGRWDADGITLAATEVGRRLGASTATRSFVIDGHVAGSGPGGRPHGRPGVSLFGVKGDADGLTRTPLATMDQTRKQARLEFADTPGLADRHRRRGRGRACPRRWTWPPWPWPPSRWAGPRRCLDMSVEYAKTRIQFGRPIGSFQAIKHKCADMLLEVESAKSAAYYAGWAAAEDSDELPVVASLAKSYCSEAYFHAAAETIQIHGGIGFTWEHPAHLYFKRAKSSELLLGDPTYHRELLAQRIGI